MVCAQLSPGWETDRSAWHCEFAPSPFTLTSGSASKTASTPRNGGKMEDQMTQTLVVRCHQSSPGGGNGLTPEQTAPSPFTLTSGSASKTASTPRMKLESQSGKPAVIIRCKTRSPPRASTAWRSSRPRRRRFRPCRSTERTPPRHCEFAPSPFTLTSGSASKTASTPRMKLESQSGKPAAPSPERGVATVARWRIR
jgi:hypothetical protein